MRTHCDCLREVDRANSATQSFPPRRLQQPRPRRPERRRTRSAALRATRRRKKIALAKSVASEPRPDSSPFEHLHELPLLSTSPTTTTLQRQPGLREPKAPRSTSPGGAAAPTRSSSRSTSSPPTTSETSGAPGTTSSPSPPSTATPRSTRRQRTDEGERKVERPTPTALGTGTRRSAITSSSYRRTGGQSATA